MKIHKVITFTTTPVTNFYIRFVFVFFATVHKGDGNNTADNMGAFFNEKTA